MSYPESNEQFNRQQGEELIAALTGEEAPDLGYPATNEPFNREQGNKLIEAVKNFSPGGLPDPSTLSDGTAAVVVNGEWKMQEGYGYTGEPAFEPITWDGSTSGKPYVEFDGNPSYYKVSDAIITAEQFIGATMVADTPYGEQTVVITEEGIKAFSGLAVVDYILSGVAGAYGEGEYAFNVPEDGTYFFKADGIVTVKSLTDLSSVHQFDSALIPIQVPIPDESSVGKTLIVKEQEDPMTGESIYKYEFNSSPLIVNFSMEENDNLSCDTPLQTLKSESSNGRAIFGVLNAGGDESYIGLYTAKRINKGSASWEIGFERITRDISGQVLNVHTIEYSYGEWTLTTNSYTLTPAT